jgi:pimeloyl-ACP methyl ester carboxylesterase
MNRRRTLLLALVVLYVGYGAVMTYLHPRYIYPFSQDFFAMPGFTRTEIDVAGTAPLGVWVHQSRQPGAPVIVYYMGNAGILSIHKAPLALHRDAGRSVIAMEYRGGGGLPGVPSEDRLKTDGLAVLDAVRRLAGSQSGPIFLHGYSMGTGIALHVASQRAVSGTVLDAPYSRICDLMRAASALPACWMPFVQKWDNLGYAGQLGAPVLIQHGAQDAKIPIAEGARLAETLSTAGGDVLFNPLTVGTHGRLIEIPGYTEALEAFLSSDR